MSESGNNIELSPTSSTAIRGAMTNVQEADNVTEEQPVTLAPSVDEISTRAAKINVRRSDLGNDDAKSRNIEFRNEDHHIPKKLRRYYKSQNELLNSIDDIQLHLDAYPAGLSTSESNERKTTWMTATRVAKVTFCINFIAAAVASGSLSVLSSVIDSSVDLASGVILWWSSRAIKHVDYSLYPRGRRKLEPVSIVVLAVIMSFASIQVSFTSFMTIVDYVKFDKSCNTTFYVHNVGNDTASAIRCDTVDDLQVALAPCMSGESGPIVELETILICTITIVVKLSLFLICRTSRDQTIQALAMDHRNDVISNTSAIMFGLIGYHLLKYADAIGAILISVYIIVNWFLMARDQIRMLTGFTASSEFINMLTWVIINHDSRIIYIDDVKAFHFGSKYFVEVDIVLPETMAIRESHDIGETLQIKLERLDQIERVFVHVDYESGYRHHLTQL